MTFKSTTRKQIYETTVQGIEPRTAGSSTVAEQFVKTLVTSLSELKLSQLPRPVIQVMANHGLATLNAPLDGDIGVQAIDDEIAMGDQNTPITFVQTWMPDQPFIFDTVLLSLKECGHNPIHSVNTVLSVKRSKTGKITTIQPGRKTPENRWSLVQIVLTHLDEAAAKILKKSLQKSLARAHAMVRDFELMRSESTDVFDELKDRASSSAKPNGLSEAVEFGTWLQKHNFVMMGLRRFRAKRGKKNTWSKACTRTLGVACLDATEGELPPDVDTLLQDILKKKRLPVDVRKTGRVSDVHRGGLVDQVLVAIPEDEDTFQLLLVWGLFTLGAVRQPGGEIPILRDRLDKIMRKDGLIEATHKYKATVNAFNTLPVEFLFEAGTKRIRQVIQSILDSVEESQPHVDVTIASHGQSLYAFAVVPSEHFSERLQPRIQRRLQELTGATYCDFRTVRTRFNNSVVHFYLNRDTPLQCQDEKVLEQHVLRSIQPWGLQLKEILSQNYPKNEAESLYYRYMPAFSINYKREVTPPQILVDIAEIENVIQKGRLGFSLFKTDDDTDCIRLRIYQYENLALSKLLPVLSQFGFNILDEAMESVQLRNGSKIAIDTFRIQVDGDPDNLLARSDAIIDSVRAAYEGDCGVDKLLILAIQTELSWRQVDFLRAAIRYLRQAGGITSMAIARKILVRHPEFATKLIHLFQNRFQPDEKLTESKRKSRIQKSERDIRTYFSSVATFEEDKVLRALYLLTARGIARTNFYLPHRLENHLISFKVCHDHIDWLPDPRPRYEVFVHHSTMEGVHMRSGPIARGGLRHSDRLEDYRTEVLGLMLTQNIKNGIIVPSGAKGGFILKELDYVVEPGLKATGQVQEKSKAEAGYDRFIEGLLDITDNQNKKGIIRPTELLCYDSDDPYFVVAADKGTARYSDRANGICNSYDFWLDDAFASGGSAGYDHKGMGITAKGAWECVKRHFFELGSNPETDPITTIGIGDMSGDVFGNGMLLSRSMKVVGAFNHKHIFLDPSPDPETSFLERKRLFELPRSQWTDYNSDLLSAGGGVYSRDAREIALSRQARKLLDIDAEKLSGSELIRALLKMPADLLWNGGVGTYVKASSERNADVRDKDNDAVRIDADELQVKVVGEGGNLGITQKARIEFSLRGGRINTDAIDNSGGVDCSDHEVNMKILFGEALRQKKLTRPNRDKIMRKLEDDVSELVLQNNRDQALMLSLEEMRAQRAPFSFLRTQQFLNRTGVLDEDLHELPTEKEIARRRAEGLSLYTRPELSILCAHSKIHLQQSLLKSNRVNPFGEELVQAYFPDALDKKFGGLYEKHPLYPAIAALGQTQVLVNHGGSSLVARLMVETDCSATNATMAMWVLKDLMGMDPVMQGFDSIQSSKGSTDTSAEYSNRISTMDGLREGAVWLLRQRPGPAMRRLVRHRDGFGKRFLEFRALVDEHLPNPFKKQRNQHKRTLVRLGLSEEDAKTASLIPFTSVVVSLSELAKKTRSALPPEELTQIYFQVAKHTRLVQLYFQLASQYREDPWDERALRTIKLHLLGFQQQITRNLVGYYIARGRKDDLDELAEEALIRKLRMPELVNQVDSALQSSEGLGQLMVFSEAYKIRGQSLKAMVDAAKTKPKK